MHFTLTRIMSNRKLPEPPLEAPPPAPFDEPPKPKFKNLKKNELMINCQNAVYIYIYNAHRLLRFSSVSSLSKDNSSSAGDLLASTA